MPKRTYGDPIWLAVPPRRPGDPGRPWTDRDRQTFRTTAKGARAQRRAGSDRRNRLYGFRATRYNAKAMEPAGQQANQPSQTCPHQPSRAGRTQAGRPKGFAVTVGSGLVAY